MTDQNTIEQTIPDDVRVSAHQSIQTREALKTYLDQICYINVFGTHKGSHCEGRMVGKRSGSHLILAKSKTALEDYFSRTSQSVDETPIVVWPNAKKLRFSETGFQIYDLEFRYVAQTRGQWSGSTFGEFLPEAVYTEYMRERTKRMRDYIEANPDWMANVILKLYEAGKSIDRTEEERQTLKRQKAEEVRELELDADLLRCEIAERRARLKMLDQKRSAMGK